MYLTLSAISGTYRSWCNSPAYLAGGRFCKIHGFCGSRVILHNLVSNYVTMVWHLRHLNINCVGMKCKTLETSFIILVIATKTTVSEIGCISIWGGKLSVFLYLNLFPSYLLVILWIIYVQDPTSINADPETSDSGEGQPQKRKYVSETIEHGSLSVISAKFEVSL